MDEKIYCVSRNHKKAKVTTLVSDKMTLKQKSIPRDQEGYFILIKASIYQEDITFIKTYAPNIRATKYMKTDRTKGRDR